MITYAAINLTNKRFYVGSTTDIVNRQRSHLNSKAEYPFQNSLRKDPENFYWIVSEEDELETRNEEQYYLNFYYGTKWCYNLNPDASCPPPTKHTEEWRQNMSEMMTGEGNPFYGRKHTQETIQKNKDFQTGRKHGDRTSEAKQKMREAKLGKTGGLCPASKKCEVVFLDGEVKVYDSVGEASQNTGIPKATLSRWARDGSKPKRKGRGNFCIRYLEV